MSEPAALKSTFRKDRIIVLASLGGVVAIAWVYLVMLARRMPGMTGAEVMGLQRWTPAQFGLMAVMWSVMMVGMMIPSATPAILGFAEVSREQRTQGETYVPTAVFVMGYVTVWIGFSLLATVLQWLLNSAALLSPAMVTTSPLLGGLILIAAGAFQWTPIHKNFLSRCRNPLAILNRRFGEGATAFNMGLENGANCLGCCMILMLLLFVGGVMNLVWVALIAVFVLVEKVLPYGDVMSRWTAVPLGLSGVVLILFHSAFQAHGM